MAAVPIQIDGVLWDHAQKKPTKVTLIGNAHILGLSVGGGPIMPPDTSPPDHIWGPTDPRPSNPIAGIPGLPGYEPPPGQPEQPLPPEPGEPPTGTPDDDGFIKAPPAEGGWGYHQEYLWLYKPAPDQAQPKGKGK